MFTTAVAAIVFAGSIAMPPMIDNDWAGPKNDWAPLQAAYQVCAETSGNSLNYFICSNYVYVQATTNMKRV